jgi:hypothetical protein
VDATGQLVVATLGLVLSVVVAVALPVLTLRRYRTPQQRRDAWLGANAQPVLGLAAHVLFAAGFLGCGLIGVLLGAGLNMTLAWALVPLSLGGLASVLITAVKSSRTPPDIEHEGSVAEDPLR